jgi:uncharacterized protein YbaR (Trm112 family)
MPRLLLHCPKCKNNMLYEPRGSIIGKSKACVYCGRHFRVKSAVLKET